MTAFELEHSKGSSLPLDLNRNISSSWALGLLAFEPITSPESQAFRPGQGYSLNVHL